MKCELRPYKVEIRSICSGNLYSSQGCMIQEDPNLLGAYAVVHFTNTTVLRDGSMEVDHGN